MEFLNKMTQHPIYIIFVLVVIWLICGLIIANGEVLNGIILILCQVPIMIRFIVQKLKRKKDETKRVSTKG